MTDAAPTRTIRSPQQIAEDAAERAYAALLAARKTKATAQERAEAAAAKAARAEAKFQNAITDYDISDDFRDRMIERLEAEVAGSSSSEAATAVPATDPGLDAAVSDAMEATEPDPLRDAIHRAASGEQAMPEREVGTPSATMKSGREDYIDGLPEGDPENGRPAVLEGTPEAKADESADSSSVVPGETPLV